MSPFISVPEAAAMLGVKRSQGYRLAESGAMPVVKLNRRLYVPRHWAERLANDAVERSLALQALNCPSASSRASIQGKE